MINLQKEFKRFSKEILGLCKDRVDIITPRRSHILRKGVKSGIEELNLEKIVQKGYKIAIAVPDKTRPYPIDIIIRELVKKLHNLGVNYDDITIIFGTGTHKETGPEYAIKILGSLYGKVKYLIHESDEHEHIYMGKTSLGTKVELLREFVEADLRISIGGVIPHPWAGFSGGFKMLLPGLSSTDTISEHHLKWYDHPGTRPGIIEGNMFRKDIEEAGRLVNDIISLELVLDDHYNVVYCSGGPTPKSFFQCLEISKRIYITPIKERYDVVIANAYPQDINLYQATRALDHASNAVKEGGLLVLFAECRLGIGTKLFEHYMSISANETKLCLERGEKRNLVPALVRLSIERILKNINLVIITTNERVMSKVTWISYERDIKKLTKQIAKTAESIALIPTASITVPIPRK